MAGIFPLAADGGLPPNSATPNNPAQAFAPTVPPLDTAPLYFGNGCNVRLRPAVVNSLISEIVATADRAGVAYKSWSLQNLETSIRYLIQRGLPRAGLFVAQNPWYYAVNLDPPATHYSDFMTLTLVPQVPQGDFQNQGYVRINVNGLGYVPLLRNDGLELHMGDLLNGKPFVASYFQGAFFYVGLCASQVPLLVQGGINTWIRTDGNDETGDGTANTAAKAFRTIEGCWRVVGQRYAATPMFSINMMLGIPGTYEGAYLGPFGGNVTLTGDPNNRWAYRIATRYIGNRTWAALAASGMSSFAVYGVSLLFDRSSSNEFPCPLYLNNTFCVFQNSGIECVTSNPMGSFVTVASKSTWNFSPGDIVFRGNGASISTAINVLVNSSFGGNQDESAPCYLVTENLNMTGAWLSLDALSTGQLLRLQPLASTTYNVTGRRYYVVNNSVLYRFGHELPGNQPGYVGEGGRDNP